MPEAFIRMLPKRPITMTTQHDKAKRWRPWQFSLRTLLFLTALTVVCVAWWIDHRRLAVRLERADFELSKSRVEAERERAREEMQRFAAMKMLRQTQQSSSNSSESQHDN